MPDTIILCKHLSSATDDATNTTLQLVQYRINLCEGCSDAVYDGLNDGTENIDLRIVEFETDLEEETDDGNTEPSAEATTEG